MADEKVIREVNLGLMNIIPGTTDPIQTRIPDTTATF